MKKSLMYLMTAVMVAVFSFSVSSCSKDDDNISKSDLVGTWYELDKGEILVFTETKCTIYVLDDYNGYYSLYPDSYTFDYTLNGDILTDAEGNSVTISINGDKLHMTNGKDSAIYTKYNGTPRQLVDYLNNLDD